MIACRLKNVILLSQRPSFRKNKRKLKNYPVIIQCCFTSETHVLMAVFVRKGTSFFNGRGRSYFNGGASFLDGVGAPLGICFDGGSFQKLILLCPMPPPPHPSAPCLSPTREKPALFREKSSILDVERVLKLPQAYFSQVLDSELFYQN